jgi:CheY-like chemotaxis protein
MKPEIAVLVVDDDEVSRYVIVWYLEAAGFHVFAAAGHNRALEILESGTPLDLLVTEIVMPGQANGFALARMASLRRPKLNVLYTTAHYADLPKAELASALGPILPKPFSSDALLRAVERAMTGARGLVSECPNGHQKSEDDAP